MGHAGIKEVVGDGKRGYAHHNVDGHDAVVRGASLFTQHPCMIPQVSGCRVRANIGNDSYRDILIRQFHGRRSQCLYTYIIILCACPCRPCVPCLSFRCLASILLSLFSSPPPSHFPQWKPSSSSVHSASCRPSSPASAPCASPPSPPAFLLPRAPAPAWAKAHGTVPEGYWMAPLPPDGTVASKASPRPTGASQRGCYIITAAPGGCALVHPACAWARPRGHVLKGGWIAARRPYAPTVSRPRRAKEGLHRGAAALSQRLLAAVRSLLLLVPHIAVGRLRLSPLAPGAQTVASTSATSHPPSEQGMAEFLQGHALALGAGSTPLQISWSWRPSTASGSPLR
jgi:hypothetical protein